MSGQKRILVDEAEWRRLRAQATALSDVKRELPGVIDKVRDQTEREVARSMNEVRSRHAEFEQAMKRLSAATRAAEERANRELRAATADLADRIGVQREELSRMVAEERRERAAVVGELTDRVAALHGDQGRAADLTERYLADAAILRDLVARLPHERYLPGRFGPLDARLRTANETVTSGLGAYGLSAAQELCHSFSELRLELETLDQQWRACRLAAERELLVVRELIDRNRASELFGQDGAGQEDTGSPSVDVDHWSRGALSSVSAEVSALLARVRDEDRPMSAADLAEVSETTAVQLRERLQEVVRQAATAMHASQLRTNLAELIADALDDRHYYEVTEAGFHDGDQRAAFVVKSVHQASGSEIVIEVAPAAEDGAPVVRMHNFDADRAAEAERAARTRSIRDSVLEYSGISLTTQEVGDHPDESVRDVAALVSGKRRSTPRALPGSEPS